MRPIDADTLIKWLNDTYCDTSKRLWNYNHHVMAMDMIEIIENYPTIEERKHGHWLCHWQEGVCFEKRVECSVCGNNETTNNPEWAYCPHCGAEMDEVSE